MQSMAVGSCQILDLQKVSEICHADFQNSCQLFVFRPSWRDLSRLFWGVLLTIGISCNLTITNWFNLRINRKNEILICINHVFCKHRFLVPIFSVENRVTNLVNNRDFPNFGENFENHRDKYC